MAAAIDNLLVETLLSNGGLNYIPTSITTTLNGTYNLTVNSVCLFFLTGTQTGFSVVLPDATTLQNGRKFIIANTTSQVVTVKNSTGATLFVLSQNSIGYIYLQLNTTAIGTWIYYQILASSTASGVINYNLTSTTPFSTSATTDTLITGFTLTPQAGTYAIWYNASVLHTTTPIAHYWSLYKAGAKVADSERQQDTAHSNQVMVDSTMAIVSLNGSQTIDVRVRRGTSGTLTVNARSLLLIRLGGA